MPWQTSRRRLPLERTLVMAILNVTPDSFSDGGAYRSPDDALRQVERFIDEGADIIDVGGESTRPGSSRVSIEEEADRVLPIIKAVSKRFDIPISIDTSKSEVARQSIEAGAEIINDISGLRWEPEIASIAAEKGTGLVLMHSRGEFETMHSQRPVEDVVSSVISDFRRAITQAYAVDVKPEQIALDIGLGFGKTFEQNLELIGKLDKIIDTFPSFPLLVGASRKSFIGKVLHEPDPAKRVTGSVVAAVIAVMNGAKFVRVHDVKPTVDAINIAAAVNEIK